LTLLALHRVGVRLLPILPALARPLSGGVFAGVVAVAVGELIGPRPLLWLAGAGAAGLVAYLAFATPPDQFRRWFAIVSGKIVSGKEAHADH
jgi:PST family polysaccharide transporter